MNLVRVPANMSQEQQLQMMMQQQQMGGMHAGSGCVPPECRAAAISMPSRNAYCALRLAICDPLAPCILCIRSMGAQQHMGILGQMPGCMHMGMPSHGGQMQGGQAQILPGLTQDMLQELMTDDVKLQNFLTENPTMMEEILKLL
jgi:hypothetical protein